MSEETFFPDNPTAAAVPAFLTTFFFGFPTSFGRHFESPLPTTPSLHSWADNLCEAIPLPTRLKFYEPKPAPNSDDIDFYKKWKGGPGDLDVDEIVKRWRSQER